MTTALLPRYSKEDFARRGEEIFELRIRTRLGVEDKGKFVVIDIETGEFEVDRDEIAASDRLLARLPEAQVWLHRVGFDHARRFGGHRVASAAAR